MRKFSLYLVFIFFISACDLGGSPLPPPASNPQPKIPTSVPSLPTLPAALPIGGGDTNDTKTEDGYEIIAHNAVGHVITDDFEIEIIRLVIGNKSYIESKTKHDFASYVYYGDSTLLGELVFRVLNSSGEEIILDFQKGKIFVNSTEIELEIFEDPITGKAMSNSFSPGENQYGSIWFGFDGLSLDKIILLRFMADAPKDGNANSIGDNIDITVDLSEYKYEEIQESLPKEFQDEFTD